MLTYIYLQFNYININVLELSYITLVDAIFITILGILVYSTFVTNNTREKLGYFVGFVIVTAGIGFNIDLDVYMFFLLSAELMAILLIFLVFLTPRKPEQNSTFPVIVFYTYLSVLYLVYLSAVSGAFSHQPGLDANLYIFCLDNSSHDLAPVFWYFVMISTWAGIIVSLLLGVFSLFFIGYYFALKSNKVGSANARQINFKRKQNFAKQRRFKTQLGIFRSRITTNKTATESEKQKPINIETLVTGKLSTPTKYVPKRKLYNTKWF